MVLRVFGTASCKFCILSKKLLDQIGMTYSYHEISNIKEYLDTVRDITGNQRTVPVIFSENCFIGGYLELVRYIENKSELTLVDDF
jgi:glutaredoxin